ncbi:MAG TPA: hypothetical protein VLK84_25410 [Longimicrobium sp.]|nr:hypothetical protein [Longimicrobium sp.]
MRVDECEACGGALRYWCRRHSREIGWLESRKCHGCAEEKARPKPSRRPAASAPAAAPPRTPAHAPSPARRAAPVHTDAPMAAGTPLAGILETREWEEKERPTTPLVMTALRIWIPLIILFALGGLYRAVVSGREISELVYEGAMVGWWVGLLLVFVLIIARLTRHA